MRWPTTKTRGGGALECWSCKKKKLNVSKQECATRDGGGRHALAFFPTTYPFGNNYVVYLSWLSWSTYCTSTTCLRFLFKPQPPLNLPAATDTIVQHLIRSNDSTCEHVQPCSSSPHRRSPPLILLTCSNRRGSPLLIGVRSEEELLTDNIQVQYNGGESCSSKHT